MFITTLVPKVNSNAIAGEALTNGDAVEVRNTAGVPTAWKVTVAGDKADGFATISTTDPELIRVALTLSEYQAQGTDPNTGKSFQSAETLPKGKRVLIQQGRGLADTDRMVAGNYQFGDKLTTNGDGKLKKASTGDVAIATVQETKVIAAGDRIKIDFHANAPETVA